jgi:hypothetical protein
VPRSARHYHGREAPLAGVGVDGSVTGAPLFRSQSIRCVDCVSTCPALDGILALPASRESGGFNWRSHDGAQRRRSLKATDSLTVYPLGSPTVFSSVNQGVQAIGRLLKLMRNRIQPGADGPARQTLASKKVAQGATVAISATGVLAIQRAPVFFVRDTHSRLARRTLNRKAPGRRLYHAFSRILPDPRSAANRVERAFPS